MNPLKGQLTQNTFLQRIKLIGLLLLLCFITILFRSFYIQVIQHSELSARAEYQHSRAVNIKLQRGTIYDSEKKLLAVSIPLDSLYAVPEKVDPKDRQIEDLALILGMEVETLENKLTAKTSFIWIKRHLTPSQSQKIMQLDLSGIHTVKEFERIYPNQSMAAQLIGFTGADSKGLEGIEYEYDQHLMGKTPSTQIFPEFGSDSPVLQNNHGGALQLTINEQIQYFAEKELTLGVDSMNADKGIVIVMESQTGAILAMANYPGFDSNFFEKSLQSTWLNRAVTDSYEPGSTFKVITVASALEHNIISSDNLFDCEKGVYKILDREIHDVVPHEWLSLEQVIQKSSNICSAKIGLSMPKELFHKMILNFGFGAKTHIGLPAEATGKVHFYKNWTDVDVATMSYGHSISASPIQLITAINSMATGGLLVKPYIIKKMWSPSGEELLIEHPPARRVVKKETADKITQYMTSVTKPGGTGYPAYIEGLEIAAKTGTARKFDRELGEYSSEKHIASFVGFFPAEQPELTILVVIDEPKERYYGAKGASPIFRNITLQAIPLLQSTGKKRKTEYPDPIAMQLFQVKRPLLEEEIDPNNPATIINALQGRTLKEILQLSSKLHLLVRVKGKGVVQEVTPGTDKDGNYFYEIELR